MTNHFGAIDNIFLVGYNPEYPFVYEAAKHQLELQLSATIQQIEHVGSTAVPGIQSKPVIDISVTASSFPIAPDKIRLLEDTGWVFWHDNPDPDHQFFFKGMPRTHILHIYPAGSGEHVNKIKFRDLLRKNTLLARQYETLKQSLAEQYADDREKYTDMKSEFINFVCNETSA